MIPPLQVMFSNQLNLFLLIMAITQGTPKSCEFGRDQIIFSAKELKSPVGAFNSPGWPNSYPSDARCLYRFVAGHKQKVKLTFDHFNVEGASLECSKDFLDVYIDIATTDKDNSVDQLLHAEISSTTTTPSSIEILPVLMKSNVLGRFCGHSLESIPRTLVSLHRDIILDFFSDFNTKENYNQDNHLGILGFNGTYEFISDEGYYPGRAKSTVDFPISLAEVNAGPMQSPIAIQERIAFQFVIEPTKPSGVILSPSYPGPHSRNMACAYLIRVANTQRIKITLTDIYMTEYKDSCIYDYISIYDSDRADSERLLGKFCGDSSGYEFYSSSTSLLIIGVFSQQNFMNLSIPYYRGYKLNYEVSNDYVEIPNSLKLNLIPGSECDYKFISSGQSEGTIIFPDLTLSNHLRLFGGQGKDCNFVFMGLHNNSLLEVVEITFKNVQLPTSTHDMSCQNGFIGLYGNRGLLVPLEENEMKLLSPYKSDTKSLALLNQRGSGKSFEFCQRPKQNIREFLKRSKTFVSDSSVMMLKYKTQNGKNQDKDSIPFFDLKYKFQNDFGIPGKKLDPKLCQFVYESNDNDFSNKDNLKYTYSPLYPDNYPNESVCIYLFKLKPKQVLRLVFNSFKIADFGKCNDDYLQVVEIRRPMKEENIKSLVNDAYKTPDGKTKDTLRWASSYNSMEILKTETYCGDVIPGPLITSSKANAVMLRFHSNVTEEASGFSVAYDFIDEPQPLESYSLNSDLKVVENVCRGNLVSKTGSGQLVSPNYPSNYPKNLNCEWQINSNNEDGIPKRLLIHFVEFSLEGSQKNCSNAQVKIFEENAVKPSMRICGVDSFVKSFATSAKFLRVVFQTSNKVIGSTGFRMIWTEILPDSCTNGFKCQVTGYCINEHLLCNGLLNCGTFHDSQSNEINIDSSDEVNKKCISPTSHGSIQIGIGVFMTIVFLGLLVIFILYRENSRKSLKANSFNDHLENFPDSKAFFNEQCTIGGKRPSTSNQEFQKKTSLLYHDELSFPQAKDFLEADSPPRHRHIYQIEDLTKKANPFGKFNMTKRKTKKNYDQLEGFTTTPSFLSDSTVNNNNINPYSPTAHVHNKRMVMNSPRSTNPGSYASSSRNQPQYTTIDNQMLPPLQTNRQLQKVSMV